MPHRPKGSRFWHYDFQIQGRRFCGSCGTEDFETAKAIEAQARVQAKAAPDQRGIYTLSEAIGTYYADVGQHQPSARTTISQGKAILAVLDGKITLDALTNADVMRFVARRRAEVANGTVNRQLQLLGRALRHMEKFHGAKIASLDLRAAETKEPAERVRELTVAEQDRLFKHLRADLHPLIKLALLTGARASELCNLTWADVDLDAGVMRFRIKGGAILPFPISREARAFLTALPRATDLPHTRYVLTYISHRHKTRPRHRIEAKGGGLWEDIAAAVAKAEIPDFRFHDLRHTFATRLLRRTGNLKLVSRLLGHTSIETTARYAHVMADDLLEALDDHSVFTVSREKSRSA